MDDVPELNSFDSSYRAVIESMSPAERKEMFSRYCLVAIEAENTGEAEKPSVNAIDETAHRLSGIFQ